MSRVLARAKALRALAAVLLVGGCIGKATSPDGGAVTEPLPSCLPGWWATSNTDCSITLACRSPSSPDRARACDAGDCRSRTYYSYGLLQNVAGPYVRVDGLGAESLRLLCASGATTATWSQLDAGHISVNWSPPASPVSSEARCAGDEARVGSTALQRVSGALAAALTARADAGSWSQCDY